MKYGEYIFGFPDGKPDFIRAIEKENERFEVFLSRLLKPRGMKRREQIRSMERAIKIVVDEIFEKAKL
ncbi:hypothetical protein HOO68_02775 [Candidatus Gracilibacteria bacterium]|nr:hypothetical protein [Candidatus Gracilibacteria bacterium]